MRDKDRCKEGTLGWSDNFSRIRGQYNRSANLILLGYDALEWFTEAIEMRREALKEFKVIAKSCNYNTRNLEMTL